MTVTLGSNISSLMTQRHLGRATDALGRSAERLSSGLRINRASDDAAGLAISMGLNTETRVATQAVRNVNDGISALHIAQGALQELSSVVQRLQELAEQSANGTFALKQRRAIGTEADALVSEYNRILQTTTFNDIQLLDGSVTRLSIQAGSGSGGELAFNITSELARNTGDGTLSAFGSYTSGNFHGIALGDLNADGLLDAVVGPDQANGYVSVMLGNGDGTFKARQSFASAVGDAGGSPDSVLIRDYNGDGKADIAATSGSDGTVNIYLGNNDGTFNARVSYATAAGNHWAAQGDLNGDGKADLIMSSYVLLGNGDGSFSMAASTGYFGYSTDIGDFDNDGVLDLVSSTGATARVLLGNGDGTFRSYSSMSLLTGANFIKTSDLDRDGNLDVVTTYGGGSYSTVFMGNGDGSFDARVTYYTQTSLGLSLADMNGDGLTDLITSSNGGTSGITIQLGNGDGSFKDGTFYAGAYYDNAIGDLNRDGALDIVTGRNALAVGLGTVVKNTFMPYLDLLSQSSARNSLPLLAEIQQHIGSEIGLIGASQSRLRSAVNTLQGSRETLSAAASRISDADVAEESARYLSSQIVQQVSAAVLSLANRSPELILQLLR